MKNVYIWYNLYPIIIFDVNACQKLGLDLNMLEARIVYCEITWHKRK